MQKIFFMIKKIIQCSLILFLFKINLFSQNTDSKDSKKIDSILNFVKNPEKNSFDPYFGKKHSIGLNVIGVLLSKINIAFNAEYTINYPNKSTELAFPVGYNSNELFNSKTSMLYFDTRYRLFFANKRANYFLGAVGRLANISGTDNSSYWESNKTSKDFSNFQMGVGIEIGTKYFSTKRITYSFSTTFGRYLIGDRSSYGYYGFVTNSYGNGAKSFIELDFKIGYTF